MSDPKSAAAATASYFSAGSAVLFGFTANEIAALVGAFCAVATFIVNWWFKYRQLQAIEARINKPITDMAGIELTNFE